MILSRNNIYLGDAYKLIKNIKSKSIDFIYVDIPYLYDNGGKGESALAKRKTKQKEELSSISNGIDYNILYEFVRVLKNINIAIWCSRKQITDICNFFKPFNVNAPWIFVWIKKNPIPTYEPFLNDIEYCLFFLQNHRVLNKDRSIPLSKRKGYYVSNINIKDKKLYLHSTIKPLEMVKNHIEICTNKDDVVLDAFAGSGTTLVACKELDRDYIGFELDKKYYKIAKDRLCGIDAQGQVSLL